MNGAAILVIYDVILATYMYTVLITGWLSLVTENTLICCVADNL